MSLLKKIGSKVKTTFAKVTTAVNNAAKTLSASSIPLVASAAQLVDGLIDDNKVEEMKAAAARDGETKVAKVEETVQAAAAAQGITDVVAINTATKVAAQKVSEETKTTLNDSEASVKVSIWEKVKAFAKKYMYYLIAAGVVLVGLVVWLCTRNGGKKKFRR